MVKLTVRQKNLEKSKDLPTPMEILTGTLSCSDLNLGMLKLMEILTETRTRSERLMVTPKNLGTSRPTEKLTG